MSPTAAWGRTLRESTDLVKNFLRATCLTAVVAGIGMTTPAFAAGVAQGATATTVTVTTGTATVLSGRGVTFHAAVTPSRVGKSKITGKVIWTITGSNGSVATCSKSSAAISPRGLAYCAVGTGQLVATASPYTVTAAYSGDSNFGQNSGSVHETVTIAPARIRLRITHPSSGAPATVTATVISGTGTKAITGQVTFAVAAVPSKDAYCSGLKTSDSQPLVANVATCSLPAGWITVPTATTSDPHPKARWTVTASFDATANFAGITRSISGTDHS